MLYGYARISKPFQNIDRQIRNIKSAYPQAVILSEAYTGTTADRPEWNKLIKRVKGGDCIVFDSVSRMSRNAAEGFSDYEALFSRGVSLVFLKEPAINTETYQAALARAVPMTGTPVDLILKGLNLYLLEIAREQIRIAFEQAEKEVADLHQRTREGMETARLNGKQIGQRPGARLTTKKSIEAKARIKELSKDFDGTLPDVDVMKLAGISRNTFYKYKAELKEAAGRG